MRHYVVTDPSEPGIDDATVTFGQHADGMDQGTKTAVCLLRAERQFDGLLITMVVTQDIATGVQEPPRHFVDAANAVAAVAAFLDDVANDPG